MMTQVMIAVTARHVAVIRAADAEVADEDVLPPDPLPDL